MFTEACLYHRHPHNTLVAVIGEMMGGEPAGCAMMLQFAT
jgi:hypothetical protein